MNQIATFFDTMAEQWDTICTHDPDKIRLILDLANIKAQARILDVGCGTGVLESYLSASRPSYILGVDIAPHMIEKAKEKYKDQCGIIHFRCQDANEVEEKNFDYIFIYSVYPHFADPEHLIGHLAGLLQPEGKLIVCHSESKETINAHHERHVAGGLSVALPPAQEVAALMKPYLTIQTIVDTEQLYIVSGKRN